MVFLNEDGSARRAAIDVLGPSAYRKVGFLPFLFFFCFSHARVVQDGAGREWLGHIQLKARLMDEAGWTVMTLDAREWQKAASREKQREMILQVMDAKTEEVKRVLAAVPTGEASK